MKLVALTVLALVGKGTSFVPSLNARWSFAGDVVSAPARAATPSTRHTRQVLKAVAAAPAVATEVLTRVRWKC